MCLPLNPHISEDVFAQYLIECLLEMKQTPIHVSNLPNMRATKDNTKPLGFQRVGSKSGKHRVTWLKHLMVPFEIRKC
jgi:hypothetical protein